MDRETGINYVCMYLYVSDPYVVRSQPLVWSIVCVASFGRSQLISTVSDQDVASRPLVECFISRRGMRSTKLFCLHSIVVFCSTTAMVGVRHDSDRPEDQPSEVTLDSQQACDSQEMCVGNSAIAQGGE